MKGLAGWTLITGLGIELNLDGNVAWVKEMEKVLAHDFRSDVGMESSGDDLFDIDQSSWDTSAEVTWVKSESTSPLWGKSKGVGRPCNFKAIDSWGKKSSGPKRPTGRPPRGARQWPYTNPRGVRAYRMDPNCNAEWRSRILQPSQLGKSHGKSDSTINRLNPNEKSVDSLGVFRRGSGGANPRKCKKIPATITCRPFAGLTGLEARKDILRKRFLYVVSKYERHTCGAYREKRLNVFFRAEIWKFWNSRISIDISAIRRWMKTTVRPVGSDASGDQRLASNFSRKRQNVLLRNQRCGAYFNQSNAIDFCWEENVSGWIVELLRMCLEKNINRTKARK